MRGVPGVPEGRAICPWMGDGEPKKMAPSLALESAYLCDLQDFPYFFHFPPRIRDLGALQEFS